MRFTHLLFLILLGSTMLFGQDTVTAPTSALREGKWAMQFQVGPNFQLQALNGATLSLKRQSSANNAQRMSISINAFTNTSDGGPISSDTIQRFNNNATNQQSINLSYLFINYLVAGEDIHPYFGFGPVAGFRRNHEETSSKVLQPHHWENGSNTNTNYSISAGMIGCLGAEWFVSKSISLTGEYSVSAVYSHSNLRIVNTGEYQYVTTSGTYSNTNNWTDEGSANSFSIGGSSVLFGLSVYF